jgi:bifunctional DNA-binding transcriptional regulator/antitoxin component of YhaV-PrlF toxin-antitoxin module
MENLVTIDRTGKVEIPLDLRHALQLRVGDTFTVEVVRDTIVLTLKKRVVELDNDRQLWELHMERPFPPPVT